MGLPFSKPLPRLTFCTSLFFVPLALLQFVHPEFLSQAAATCVWSSQCLLEVPGHFWVVSILCRTTRLTPASGVDPETGYSWFDPYFQGTPSYSVEFPAGDSGVIYYWWEGHEDQVGSILSSFGKKSYIERFLWNDLTPMKHLGPRIYTELLWLPGCLEFKAGLTRANCMLPLKPLIQ